MSKKRSNTKPGDPARTKPLPELQQQANGGETGQNKVVEPGAKTEKSPQPAWVTALREIAPVLTAIGAILGSLVAILGTLNQAGVFRKPTPPPTVTMTLAASPTLPPPTGTFTLTPVRLLARPRCFDGRHVDPKGFKNL